MITFLQHDRGTVIHYVLPYSVIEIRRAIIAPVLFLQKVIGDC
jgi:hypothetical protein